MFSIRIHCQNVCQLFLLLSSATNNEENIKRSDVLKTREFQKELKDLNVSQIIKDFDPENIHQTKLRLMKSTTVGIKNNPADEMMKKMNRKKNEELQIIQRNIGNAEKLLMQFKEPVGNIDDGPGRHILMKLCNDERAYLEYKKRRIKFN